MKWSTSQRSWILIKDFPTYLEMLKKIQNYHINICIFNDNSLLAKLSMRYLEKKKKKRIKVLLCILRNIPRCLSIEIRQRLKIPV